MKPKKKKFQAIAFPGFSTSQMSSVSLQGNKESRKKAIWFLFLQDNEGRVPFILPVVFPSEEC
jgi:hypothetical protein